MVMDDDVYGICIEKTGYFNRLINDFLSEQKLIVIK